MNNLIVIHPYVHRHEWVFDDASKELDKEPFVAGMDVILDVLTKDIPNARKGVTLIASGEPFPGHQVTFRWMKREHGGNWYREMKTGMEGWLCPALLKYFDKAPKKIYVQIKAKGN
jgi:hypothetical protein